MTSYKFSFLLLLLLACAVAFICPACVSQTPTPQYADNLSFAVAYTHDDVNAMTSAPIEEEVRAALDQVLSKRNLKVAPIAFDSIKPQLEAIRDTDRRIQALKASANGSQFILLTEISTEFYSPLSGRYRWNVNVNVTIYDMVTRNTLNDKFTVPAALMYAHENGDDAIESVQAEIERHIGSLIDRFMKGRVTRNDAAATPVAAAPEGATHEAPEKGASPKAEAIYFVLIDRFFNAQNDINPIDLKDPVAWHGGDLEGVRQKLDWLANMGITKIWLSPVFTAASENFFGNAAFHAYWTYDLNTIDTHFGTENDLLNLAQTAQSKGIGIILDFVVNHVGYGSPLVEQKPDWFNPALTIEDWNDPIQLTQRQVHGLPDLNQDNPEVYDYIMKAAHKWIGLPNIAGYRLDAVKHVDLKFWTKFNTAMQAQNPNLMLLGEYFDGDPKKVDDIQKAGKFTHLFDFPLTFALRDVFCEHKSVANLASVISNDRFYTAPNQMVTFIDNHDMPRFISLCQNDTAAMGRALRVLLAWRGIPSLYYGTETPLAGAKEPDNRADMDFQKAEYYKLIQNALKLRSNHPVLASGTTSTLTYRPGFAVFARELNQEQSLLIVSQAKTAQSYTLPEGVWRELGTNRQHQGNLTVEPESVRLFVRSSQTPLISHERRTITFHLPTDGTYAITGSAPELGLWNPQAAPRTSNGTITLELPAQTVVVYKPVKINGDQVTWADGDNRELFSEEHRDIQVKW